MSCVSCAQVYGGMRGMKGLVYETSVLDPDEVSARSGLWQTYLLSLPG